MLTGMIEPSSGTASICGYNLRREPMEVIRTRAPLSVEALQKAAT